jgi:SAM-dependent methyltransferase
MTDRYDSAVARHYAAYRPPLHRVILERVLRPGEFFQAGLDIGCGTGYSAVALTRYCGRVLGLDPSPAMLAAAQRHPGITYLHGSGDALGRLPVPAVDAVTFAGSLFYAKTGGLRKELGRVCAPGATILVYDFEVFLGEAMAEAGVDDPAPTADYDHQANLSGWAEFALEGSGAERVQLAVSGNEMAHLLLADSNRYDAFLKRFPSRDPFELLAGSLSDRGGEIPLQAGFYFTRYRILGK